MPASTTLPKVGARVRVVLEGPVGAAFEADIFGRPCFTLGDEQDGNAIHPAADHVKSVEVLPEPESWEPGDIVLSALGGVYARSNGDTWRGFSGLDYPEVMPSRPLTLIARNGKPVAA